jgi:hypothetical protein
MNGYSRRYWLKIFHWATQAHPPILSQRISHHTVPSGTGLRGRPFLALNCQATIIRPFGTCRTLRYFLDCLAEEWGDAP